MQKKCIKLIQPPLLDFSLIQKHDNVKIVIKNTEHKFAIDAALSGKDIKNQPIFGCTVYINEKKFSTQSYGLPFMSFPQGSTPKITYENETHYTFNIHYHGLNTVGSVDGTTMESVFGHSTQLGPKVTFQFPMITNNQCLLWFHSHNMFVSMELIYSGLIGLLQITDAATKWLADDFKYGDNQILLEALDMDLTSTGKQTYANLAVDENRSNFAIINGISAVNWHSSDPNAPFVNHLFHITTRNLVKIDILNASLNWRVFYIGICDEDGKIKSFYQIQTDCGLINPKKLKIAAISVASRTSILIDLNKFKNQIAFLFFYNYDLTEIFDTTLAFPDQVNNSTLIGTVPDLNTSINPTPYPTPIPDPNKKNQQDEFTNLNYPNIKLIPQTNEILTNGSIGIPKKNRIKAFLKIELDKKQTKKKLHLGETLSRIRKTVFGTDTYDKYKHLIKDSDFEYNPKFNYLSFLNKKYFYNLPDFLMQAPIETPTRNIFLFSETNINANTTDGNINGTTEYVDGANRIMADLWNSVELNLDYAIQQYIMAPNNYKPTVLPTSKFRIYKTNDDYSNTAMISNDTLSVEIFANSIDYGDIKTNPMAKIEIIFPATDTTQLLNLQQWINLVNETFLKTPVNFYNFNNLSDIIKCDWSFFPYALDFLYQKAVYVKSAVIKTTNNTKYWIRFSGRWPLLQFFGKPMTGDILDVASNLSPKQNMCKNLCKNIINDNESNGKHSLIERPDCYAKCDEERIYGIYDVNVQQIFPFYATSDGEVQLPIACMKRNAELIIKPKQTYIGLYDGYLNDNLNSFSVKLKTSEIWIYSNADTTDSHPLHFHLTSGFTATQSVYNSPGLVSKKREHDSYTYSRDIYKIGPQETISFYLTWPHYASDERTKNPSFRYIGGVTHCHFMMHNDANSMIIQYYVDE